jgi:hypothetical protein
MDILGSRAIRALSSLHRRPGLFPVLCDELLREHPKRHGSRARQEQEQVIAIHAFGNIFGEVKTSLRSVDLEKSAVGNLVRYLEHTHQYSNKH